MGVKTLRILENVNKTKKVKIILLPKMFTYIYVDIEHFPFRHQKTVIKVNGNSVDIVNIER